MQLCTPEWFRREGGIEVLRPNGGVALLAPGIPYKECNRAIGLGLTDPFTRAAIEALVDTYRGAGARHLVVQWSPCARPADVPDRLAECGFVPRGTMAKLWRHCDGPVRASTDLRIEQIGDRDATTFGEIACAVYGLPAAMVPALCSTVGAPGWRHYFAYDGATPVATAALFVDGRAGWCGLSTTITGHRRRGAQTALLARRIGDATALGCEIVAAETLPEQPDRPNPSLRNMLKAGFELLYLRTNFVLELGALERDA